jgi:hypothetical protein
MAAFLRRQHVHSNLQRSSQIPPPLAGTFAIKEPTANILEEKDPAYPLRQAKITEESFVLVEA